MLQKMIIEGILKKIAKKWKLDKLIQYVEEPNDADERIDKLETDLVASNKRNDKLEDTVFQQGKLIEMLLINNNKEKE